MFFKKAVVPVQKEDHGFSVLAELLSNDKFRETLLAAPPMRPQDPKELAHLANSVVNHTKSNEYKEWAKEAWLQVISDLKTIMSPKASREEVDMARGSLRATADLLAVSYKAHRQLVAHTKAQANSSSRQTLNVL